MKRQRYCIVLGLLLGGILSAQSAPPDAPITALEYVNAAGRGFLLEPETPPISGLPGRAHALGAYYLHEHGQTIKDMGFTSVRLRYQVESDVVGEALIAGPPYDDRVLDDMERIVDDLISNDMAVVLTFYGLTEDNPGDFDKMTNWWGFVANRFKDKSHLLSFNYFVEPWELSVNNTARYEEYQKAITAEVRKTNPDRVCIGYYTFSDDYSMDANGAETLNPVSPPDGEGRYWIWDMHLLKVDFASNERRCVQALEYSNATKIPFWIGAWDTRNYYVEAYTNQSFWGVNEDKWAFTEGLLQKRLQQAGIPGEYLMFYDGGTSLYDGDADRDGNGITNEWMFPQVAVAISNNFPTLWMNLLENAGFEYDTNGWSMGGSVISSNAGIVGAAAQLDAGDILSQDTKKALTLHGQGTYDILLHGKCTSPESVTVQIRVQDDSGDHVAASQIISFAGDGSWEFATNTLSISWEGTLQSASLEVVYNGSAPLYLDDLGLTRFYRSTRTFDTSMWPNGHRMPWKLYFGSKTVASQLINVRRSDAESAYASDALLADLTNDYNNASTDLERLHIQDQIDARLFALDPEYMALFWEANRFLPAAIYTNDFIKTGAGVGTLYQTRMMGTDYWTEGEMPLFSKTSGPAWLSVGSDGSLSGTPSSSDLGTNSFILSVNDGIATSNLTLKVVVDSTANGPAVWSRGNTYTATEDTEFSNYLKWMTDDPEDDPRLFEIVSAPDWLFLTPYTGKLYGTPGQKDVGTVEIVLSVTDNMHPTSQTNFTITVSNVNDAPVFTEDLIDGGTASTGTVYSSTLEGTATDEDGDTLTYAKVSGPAWLSIASDGSISGTPSGTDVGTNEWTVSATDTSSASTNATLRIVVTDNTPPYWKVDPFVQDTISAGSNYTRWIKYRCVDENGDALTIAKVSGPSWLTVANPSTGKIQGTPSNSDAGTNTFIMSVSDGKADPVEGTMYIIVKSYNQAWNDFYGLTGTDADSDADPDGDLLENLAEYALGSDPTNALSGTNFLPECQIIQETTGDWMEYIYRRRTDAAQRDLTYSLQVSEDLQTGAWEDDLTTEIGTNTAIETGFEMVTNRVNASGTKRFVHLRIEMNE